MSNSDARWMPGPGNYEPNYNVTANSHSYGFGTSKRQEIGQKADKKLNVPGPGQYSIPVSFDGLKPYEKPPTAVQ